MSNDTTKSLPIPAATAKDVLTELMWEADSRGCAELETRDAD